MFSYPGNNMSRMPAYQPQGQNQAQSGAPVPNMPMGNYSNPTGFYPNTGNNGGNMRAPPTYHPNNPPASNYPQSAMGTYPPRNNPNIPNYGMPGLYPPNKGNYKVY